MHKLLAINTISPLLNEVNRLNKLPECMEETSGDFVVIDAVVSEYFGTRPTYESTSEFVILGHLKHDGIFTDILAQFAKKIEETRLIEPLFYLGLTEYVSRVFLPLLEKHKANLFKLAHSVLTKIKANDSIFSKDTYEEFVPVFDTLAILFYKLHECGGEGWNGESIRNPLFETFKSLTRHSYFPIRYKATWIVQVLAAIKQDKESQRQELLKRGFMLGTGVLQTAVGVYSGNAGMVFDGITSFSKGMKSLPSTQKWFYAIAHFRTSVSGVHTNPEKMTECILVANQLNEELGPNEYFAFGVVDALRSIALHSTSSTLVNQALSLFKDIFVLPKWGKYESVRNSIIEYALTLFHTSVFKEESAAFLQQLNDHFEAKLGGMFSRKSKGLQCIQSAIPGEGKVIHRIESLKGFSDRGYPPFIGRYFNRSSFDVFKHRSLTAPTAVALPPNSGKKGTGGTAIHIKHTLGHHVSDVSGLQAEIGGISLSGADVTAAHVGHSVTKIDEGIAKLGGISLDGSTLTAGTHVGDVMRRLQGTGVQTAGIHISGITLGNIAISVGHEVTDAKGSTIKMGEIKIT